MIKKVPGIKAWVLHEKDFPVLQKMCLKFDRNWGCKELPLFDLTENEWLKFSLLFGGTLLKNSRLIVILDESCFVSTVYNALPRKIKTEYVQPINKVWDEFYQ